MDSDLMQLREVLLQGIRLSKQRSYGRRKPASPAIPYLAEARSGLRSFVETQPNSIDAWRLLSQAEECLLHYREAIDCLQTAMRLEGKRDKRDLKRLAGLHNWVEEWQKLPLTPAELHNLGDFLVEMGCDDEANGRSLRFTREWLEKRQCDFPGTVLTALGHRGGFTDFQVLHNVVRG